MQHVIQLCNLRLFSSYTVCHVSLRCVRVERHVRLVVIAASVEVAHDGLEEGHGSSRRQSVGSVDLCSVRAMRGYTVYSLCMHEAKFR